MHVDNSSATVYRPFIQRWMWGAFAFLATATLIAVIAFAPLPAGASGLQDKLNEILASILGAIVSIVGKLLLAAIYLLTLIAQYNNFIDADAVKNGWVIVRDVANMFFIVVLLIIAFATILNVSSYQWKAMLPQLLIAAILINFSKTIAGIFIDISQVIMLTFVNGFAAAAGGNFANMFQIRGLLSLDPNAGVAVGLLQILGGYLLAFVLVTIALVTTLIMAVILAFRIVMLWALVVLSPLPYLLNILPAGKKYGEKWWSMFGEYLTAGPVLAFFLWLALVSIGSGTVADSFTSGGGSGTSQAEVNEVGQLTGGAIPTEAASPKSLLSFVIGICMLLAGLKITGEMSVMGAGAAKAAPAMMGRVAKRVSGYAGVRDRVGAAWKMRESARSDRIQAGGAKLYGAYGAALAAPGKGIDALKGKIPQGFRDRAGKWASPLQTKVENLRKEAAAARLLGTPAGIATAKSKERQARWVGRASTAAGVGLKAGMVAAAPFTGGASLLGLVPAAVRQAQKAGTSAQEAGKDYKFKAVKSALDAMKDMKPDEVRKQLDNPTASNAERQAAFLKATQDGLLDPNEAAGGESFLESLGADKKTISTFKSYAEKGPYAGTMLSRSKEDRDERKRRISDGRMPTKDLNPKELSGDGGSLAADFVLHGNDAQRKELGNSTSLKAAYKKGLQDASATEADPANKQKLQTELMRLGGDGEGATRRTALQVSGMDPAALGKALQGSSAPDVLANIEPSELTDDIVDLIAANVPAARFRAAKGGAAKGDDSTKAVNMAAIEAKLKTSKGYQTFDRGQAGVRGATGRVGGVRKSFDSKSAELARTSTTDPAYAAIKADAEQLERDLDQAEKDLDKAKADFEAEMKASGVNDNMRELYTSMQTKRK